MPVEKGVFQEFLKDMQNHAATLSEAEAFAFLASLDELLEGFRAKHERTEAGVKNSPLGLYS